jgi:hypothetical protein
MDYRQQPTEQQNETDGMNGGDGILGEEDIFVEIQVFPGLTVRSGYRNLEINRLSKKLLRIALSLCGFQILLAIINAIIKLTLGSLISSVANIFLYILIYCLAYVCVRYKNQKICCECMTPLTIYRIYLYITTFILTIILIINLVAVIYDSYWRIIGLFIVAVLYGLNIAEIYYSRRLSMILNEQIHPIEMSPEAMRHEEENNENPL